MAHESLNQFNACLSLPLQEKLNELTRIIDQCSPNRELQSLFPQLTANIFGNSTYPNGWDLRSICFENHRYEFQLLHSFLAPQGPMFRLCYKLLIDPQLKYNLPLQILPLDLQFNLERGRYPSFYSDLISVDPHSMNIGALALNPFDYYIFNFALLLNNTTNESLWENVNNVYFTLACDYLVHFLPSDPNVSVLPLIPHYTGKVPMVAPLQSANRTLHTPSLLLKPDLLQLGNQHTSTQSQSRNEVWRTESVIQIFIDIWMSVEEFPKNTIESYNRSILFSPINMGRVRTVRVLIKRVHAFASKHLADPVPRSAALRKYASQTMCSRAFHYIKHLVATWPLDTSFRFVMELWLSLLQPWRYTEVNDYVQNRSPNNNDENTRSVDDSYVQFIAENFPSYIVIFQMVLPRFMRVDLSATKNAIMLFRLGKVFSQPNLIPILKDLEHAVVEGGNIIDVDLHQNLSRSQMSSFNQSYTDDNFSAHRFGSVAKQSLAELNIANNYIYEPIWCQNTKPIAFEFIKTILSAKIMAEKSLEELTKNSMNNKGFWSFFNFWSFMNLTDNNAIEEYKRVPSYLDTTLHQFSHIFGLSNNEISQETLYEENSMEESSIMNNTHFPYSITNKLRQRNKINYMGNPDLMPIMSYESTILVRMLYQLSTKLNETYGDIFERLWNKTDFIGKVAREILQYPSSIQILSKDSSNQQSIISLQLPPRLSLRRLGSYSFVVWMTVGYLLFRFIFGYSGIIYLMIIFKLWIIYIITKVVFTALRI